MSPSLLAAARMVLFGWKLALEFGVALESGRKGDAEGHRVVDKEGDRFAPPSLSANELVLTF